MGFMRKREVPEFCFRPNRDRDESATLGDLPAAFCPRRYAQMREAGRMGILCC